VPGFLLVYVVFPSMNNIQLFTIHISLNPSNPHSLFSFITVVVPQFCPEKTTDTCLGQSRPFSVKNSAERYFKIPHSWFRVGPSSLKFHFLFFIFNFYLLFFLILLINLKFIFILFFYLHFISFLF